MQPIIGVTMTIDDDLVQAGVEYSFIRRQYGQALKLAGAQPIFLDPSIDPAVAAKLCDGLVISGGQDIDPGLYGQELKSDGKLEPRSRTDWEYGLIAEFEKLNQPILGVCYGNQLLNVYHGGTLYQDILTEVGGDIAHGSTLDQATHDVTFEVDFLGFRRGDKKPVAARHHQAVRDLGDGFVVVAKSEDGVIEAISSLERQQYGVQWHTESDDSANLIYGEFIGKCQPR